jgi:AcrR family transcriptional regulator
MPRISAPTVAEHRARQRSHLVRAGSELLADGGVGAVTLAAVGQRVGLARSSVYEYFSSTAQLLGAVLAAGFAQWAERVRQDVDSVGDPLARVDAYVRRTLQLVADGQHKPLAAVGRADLDPDTRAGIARSHQALVAPLISALTELGVADPALLATLLQGVVDAASRQLELGRPGDAVIPLTIAVVRAAVLDAVESGQPAAGPA